MHIALFLTRGMSLSRWDEVGMLSREIALYERLGHRDVRVTLVSYGGPEELAYSFNAPGINVCCNRWRLPKRWYLYLLPWLHKRALEKVDLFKTNQTPGSEIALRTATFLKKPLIARCGYMWSEFVSVEQGSDSAAAAESLAIEEQAFRGSDAIVVTTEAMRNSIVGRFAELGKKVNIIPNYVDTEKFSPCERHYDGPVKLCFVGRLAEQKNLVSLVKAVRGLDVALDIVGQGPMEGTLRDLAKDNQAIRFLGKVSNDKLPSLLVQNSAFVLPSHYEGHPKTPLEAMACGLPVIGTNVSGIREIIKHKETGWLCETDVESLRNAIRAVTGDSALQASLGCQARKFVLENFSLERIVSLELDVYREVLRESFQDK